MRKCSIDGCDNNVWSKGLCKNHIPKKPLKCVRNHSLTRKTSDYEREIIHNPENMFEFFKTIWNKRNHECENCKEWLGKEPLSYHFDHLLEKKKYPELKFEEENIMLLCFKCHDNKTRGFISVIIQKRINEVKNKYIFAKINQHE